MQTNHPQTTAFFPPPLGPDVLQGAKEIATFIFGSDVTQNVRRVYYLSESKQLPVFRMSKTGICARRSTIQRWIEAQEAASYGRGLDLPQ